MLGKTTLWSGALETEYFKVLFAGGVSVVSINDREMELNENPGINYAESQSLLDTVELIKTSSIEEKISLRNEYNLITSIKEQDEITFADIMRLLNWKYAENARVDESDMLGD